MGFLFIALGTLMWSLDTLIRYPLLAALPADTIVFIEHLFLLAYFVPFLLLNKFNVRRLNKAALIAFIFIGVVGSAASTVAFTKAFSLINPSLVILLQKLQPFAAIGLSSILLKEKMNSKFFAYGLLAFIGAFLISYSDITVVFQGSTDRGAALGYFLTLFAVLGWGASTVFGKKLSLQEFTEGEIMAGRFIFGFLFLVVYCCTKETLPKHNLQIDVYFKIFVMVLISGLIGMYFYYKGLKRMPAHLASIAELFFPLSAVTINWIFLGKALTILQITGALILIAASTLLQRSQKD